MKSIRTQVLLKYETSRIDHHPSGFLRTEIEAESTRTGRLSCVLTQTMFYVTVLPPFMLTDLSCCGPLRDRLSPFHVSHLKAFSFLSGLELPAQTQTSILFLMSTFSPPRPPTHNDSLQEILGDSENRLLPLRSQNSLRQLLVRLRGRHSDSGTQEAVQFFWYSQPGTVAKNPDKDRA